MTRSVFVCPYYGSEWAFQGTIVEQNAHKKRVCSKSVAGHYSDVLLQEVVFGTGFFPLTLFQNKVWMHNSATNIHHPKRALRLLKSEFGWPRSQHPMSNVLVVKAQEVKWCDLYFFCKHFLANKIALRYGCFLLSKVVRRSPLLWRTACAASVCGSSPWAVQLLQSLGPVNLVIISNATKEKREKDLSHASSKCSPSAEAGKAFSLGAH